MTYTLCFDIGNVLLSLDHDRAFKRLAKHLNPLTAMYIWARKKEFLKEIQADQELLETGRMTLEQFYSRLKGKTGCDVSYDEFSDIWCDIFIGPTATLDYAQQLARTYTCCLASNTNKVHAAFIFDKYPSLQFAQHQAFSHEVRAMKPDPAFFSRMCDICQSPPNQCIFVDDNTTHVDAARTSGMIGIHYTDHDALVQELATHGVAPPSA